MVKFMKHFCLTRFKVWHLSITITSAPLSLLLLLLLLLLLYDKCNCITAAALSGPHQKSGTYQVRVTANRSRYPLQKSDHVKGWLHQRLCETESRAHSETGTDIVVILHKTLNLTFYNGVQEFISRRGFVSPRHPPSPYHTQMRAQSTLFKPEGTRAILRYS